MSVNVCVLRNYTTNVEIARYDNQSTTPVFNLFSGTTYRLTRAEAYYFISTGVNYGATKAFPLPINAYSTSALTTLNGKFLLETGYVASVLKNINSDDISVSVRTTSDPASTEKTTYLTGETGYYHTSVAEGSKYRFVEWRNGATQISTDAILSRTITADLTLTAVYEQYRWATATQSSNATVGDAYVGSTGTLTTTNFENNSFVTLRAVVKDAYQATYKFKRWTLDGVEVSTEPTIQITTGEEDTLYVAVFIPINYELNVSSQNVDQGSVEVYLSGTKQVSTTGLTVAGLSGVEVRAIPTFGYLFAGWHNGTSIVSYLSSYSLSMLEANLSLQARFSILPDAPLVVTKKIGNGTVDPKSMGTVSLYHTVDTFVSSSPAGTLTLQSDLFTTKQYRLVPAVASSLYQFDGWYKTVDGTDVLIVDDTIFNVDGNDLYIAVADETAINVIARFSERVLCTIAPVASDSSTYAAENDAETAGCTCSVTTLPPDYDADSDGLHDVGDKWLSGQSITMQAQQAVGWELRAWIVKRVSDGQVVSSKSKGDVGFGQTFAFTILADVQIIAVSAYTLPPNQFQIQVLIKTGQPNNSGTLEIHPCGDSYVEMSNGASANVDEDSICEITAIPANGYKFIGWRVASEGSSVISTNPVYLFTVSASAIYYAEFAAVTEEMLILFESSSANATMRWAGKTLVSSVPVCLSSARVYADAYPVKLSIGMSDNPSHPANAGNLLSSLASTQSPFRLPLRRPRKSIVLEIEATDTVSAVSVATSMEDLKNG